MNWVYFRLITAAGASLCCFGLGVFAYLKNRHVRCNQFFAISNLFLGLWNLSDIAIAYSSAEKALFFDRLSYVWGTLVVPAFLFMSLEFCEKRLSKKWLTFGLALPTLVLIPCAFTSALIKGVNALPYFEEIPGPLYAGFILYFLTWVGYGVFSLFMAYRGSIGARKNQLKYVFFAFFLSFFAAVSYFAFMADPRTPPFFYVLETTYTAVMAYAIIKYRVMDINLVFRYGVVYALLLALIGLPFALAAWWSHNAWIDGLIAFAAPLIGYFMIDEWKGSVTAAVDQLPPFRGKYDRYDDDYVEARRDSIVNAPSLHLWAQNVLRSVRDILDVEQGAVLVHDASYDQFVTLLTTGLPHLEGSPISLDNKGPVAAHLQREGSDFLAKDDLLLEVSDDILKEINEELSLFSAQVCVPLRIQDRLAGLLMVGAKRNEEMFTSLDVGSLRRVRSGAQEALRALLSGLTQRQFSSSWAHDLMHPFGPKGSFQLLVHALQGKHGELPDTLKKDLSLVLKEVGYVWDHMGALLNPLKHLKDEQARLEDQPLTPVFERTRAKYEQLAREQGVHWVVTPPAETVRVRCDADNLEHRVFINLVDNAFRYVKAGGSVELGHRMQNGSVIVYVKDTGPGVPEDKKAKLFETRFSGNDKNGGKAGWGLFNARTAVEAHGGKIWVDSEAGNGASFCFKLPVVHPGAASEGQGVAA
jgi:signal transduction histidine kinase